MWKRQGLENLNNRLRALEATVARERHILTEAQLAAVEKAKVEKEAHGEFESECPGYCGAQATFDVGTLKGVGRMYQQTFIDTYSKVAAAKLYDRKTALPAAELLIHMHQLSSFLTFDSSWSRRTLQACSVHNFRGFQNLWLVARRLVLMTDLELETPSVFGWWVRFAEATILVETTRVDECLTRQT